MTTEQDKISALELRRAILDVLMEVCGGLNAAHTFDDMWHIVRSLRSELPPTPTKRKYP